MNKQKQGESATGKKEESVTSLKKETPKKGAAKKGYNEENPGQPQGAFPPASMHKKP